MMTLALMAALTATEPTRILVMSRTEGYRHDSIPTGVECLKAIGTARGWEVDHTENPADFNTANLARYRVVVFLSTTGDILDRPEEQAFESYIQNGGRFLGIHAAADTEYDWPWFGQLVGAYFMSHPHIQEARMKVHTHDHSATAHLGEIWTATDEWYCYKSQPPARAQVLLSLDHSSYTGWKMEGDIHPIAWSQRFDGGKSFYTGRGHTKESYAEPDFRKHLAGALTWLMN